MVLKMVLNWMAWERVVIEVVIEVVIGSWMETGS
jgi:hypothetical protein